MTAIVISSLLLALVIYISIGISIGRKAKGIADLLPISADRAARVSNAAEFSSSTVATTISLATVVMAFFMLAPYYGIWLFWTVITTAAGLILVRLFAKRIWQRMAIYDHRPTLHEFLGTEFNSKTLSTVGAVCTSLGFLSAFAVELTVGSKFLAGLVPSIPAWLVIVALSLVAFFYTAIGGFRAVIITDRIQMISIWVLLISLPAFYIYYIATHGGFAENFAKVPEGTFSFSYSDGLLSFLLGILVMNVPSFISDMSLWQRIAAAKTDSTVTKGLTRGTVSAVVTWSVFLLLACLVFMIIRKSDTDDPLVALLNVIKNTGGIFAGCVLFVTVLGLYGAMLSTASTQLIAVSHTIYQDIVGRVRKLHPADSPESKKELNISRLVLVITAFVSVVAVQWLSSAGFSIANLVFAIYGAQVGLCPVVMVALLLGRKRLKRLSFWAGLAVSLSFITGWGVAIYGKFGGNENLVFLAPVWSFTVSSVLMAIAVALAGRKEPSVNMILIKSIMRARKAGLYRLVPADKPMRLDCLMDKCAICCGTLGTPVTTAEEAKLIDPNAMMKEKGSLFVRSQSCACILLKDGLCGIYKIRPRGCREYPWYNINGKLYYDKGCPGVKYDINERPATDDIQPFENFLPNAPKFIISLVKRICIRN